MLEKFNTQKDLSWCQLCWQEFLSQYDMTIVYIRGEDNTIANVLSRIAPNTFPDEIPVVTKNITHPMINTILSITSDHALLDTIKAGYEEDAFCL